MPKIYICYLNNDVAAVFSTKELAEQFATTITESEMAWYRENNLYMGGMLVRPDPCFIEEFELDYFQNDLVDGSSLYKKYRNI